uniref:Uncharacterized protein n=1 Tax=Photinus pyralis TaxID=7054 RepID=A0A1Y1MIR0_PHOPY
MTSLISFTKVMESVDMSKLKDFLSEIPKVRDLIKFQGFNFDAILSAAEANWQNYMSNPTRHEEMLSIWPVTDPNQAKAYAICYLAVLFFERGNNALTVIDTIQDETERSKFSMAIDAFKVVKSISSNKTTGINLSRLISVHPHLGMTVLTKDSKFDRIVPESRYNSAVDNLDDAGVFPMWLRWSGAATAIPLNAVTQHPKVTTDDLAYCIACIKYSSLLESTYIDVNILKKRTTAEKLLTDEAHIAKISKLIDAAYSTSSVSNAQRFSMLQSAGILSNKGLLNIEVIRAYGSVVLRMF